MLEETKKKTILSFVRRQGRFSLAHQQALNQHWSVFGLNPEQGLLDFKQIFPWQDQLILEIGFGMGQSLLSMAAANPSSAYIGIEVHRPGLGAVLHSLHAQQLVNVRLFAVDCKTVLNENIPNESLDGINIFFPDPWPKKRHHKRRLIQADFVNLLADKLKLGAKLQLATDWQAYALQMLDVLSQQPKLSNTADGFAQRADRPMTKFELRGMKEGRNIWDLIFVKSVKTL